MRSPKLQASPSRMVTPGSKYYAGYEAGFVEDLIPLLGLAEDACILDPWNGAGTTTAVAERCGRESIGLDINPVLVIVAKSKQHPTGVEESLEAIVNSIVERARDAYQLITNDPLEQWFKPGTASYLRSLESSIYRTLVSSTVRRDLTSEEGLAGVSALAASFYVVLFETVRSFVAKYRTTNPTWVKTSQVAADRLSLPKDLIDARFRSCELRMHAHLQRVRVEPKEDARAARSSIHLGSSNELPLATAMVDACISSPPYCTRIDYPILTRPELAVLGIGNDGRMRSLREATIGTTTISKDRPVPVSGWGTTATDFVDAVARHKSRASSTYYRSFYLQYFDMMYLSMKELRRVIKPGAPLALVVQDSWYKEIHIDLALALADMAAAIGWSEVERLDFEVPRTMAGIHAPSQRYRISSAATESLVVLR